MSTRVENLGLIKDCGVIAVIRADESDSLFEIVKALVNGGIIAVEITMTTPSALEAIAECAKKNEGDFILGAGTVLDPETARAAILSGAEYIVTPTLNPDVITLGHRYDKIVIPGALTPTEILKAWECGADMVKVFPATAMGPQYFKDIKAPLPQIEILPTGGGNLDNAADFISAGASAIAVGSSLVDKKAVGEGRWEVLTDIARRYVDVVRDIRRKGA